MNPTKHLYPGDHPHILSYATFDDLECVGKIFVPFNDNSEIKQILMMIMDCYVQISMETDYDTLHHKKDHPGSFERLGNEEYYDAIVLFRKKNIQGELSNLDPTGSYFNFINDEKMYIDEVVTNLKENKYHVVNRYDKYYVHAFAIDFTTFYIFSKDYSVNIIDWTEHSINSINIVNGPFVGSYPDDGYYD